MCSYVDKLTHVLGRGEEVDDEGNADVGDREVREQQLRGRLRDAGFISQNVLFKWFRKVNSPSKSSTYCLLLLIKTIS